MIKGNKYILHYFYFLLNNDRTDIEHLLLPVYTDQIKIVDLPLFQKDKRKLLDSSKAS